MIKLIKNVLMVSSLLVVFSCSKETQPEQTKVEHVIEVSISELKAYMSKLINVKVEEIGYNEKTEQFSIAGVDQISKKELTESYKRNAK